MAISIEVDREHDQLYLLLRESDVIKGSVARSIRLADDVVADLDAEGRLVGLDLTQASRVLGVDLNTFAVSVNFAGGRERGVE